MMAPRGSRTWNGNTVNVKRDTGSAIETRYSETRVLPIAARLRPTPWCPITITRRSLAAVYNLKWQNVNDYVTGNLAQQFRRAGRQATGTGRIFPPSRIATFSEAWAIVEPWYTSLGRPAITRCAECRASRHAPAAGTAVLTNTMAPTTPRICTAFPAAPVCGRKTWCSASTAIGGSAATGGVCRYSAPVSAHEFCWAISSCRPSARNVVKLSVDGDGRIWAAVMPDVSGNSGGLSAYEVLGPANTLGTVRTQDWNWLTAPIGSRHLTANGWNSGIRAITANVERVWMALNTDPNNGPLAMYSPRWQQLTAANEGSLWGVRKVFLARGRAFLATNGDRLVTLQPDGITWDDRALAGVKAVTRRSARAASGSARAMVCAAGRRRGWDMIDGALGTPPTGPINAIAEDSKGRVWIGGENGLTLFDRERWVTTIAPPHGCDQRHGRDGRSR